MTGIKRRGQTRILHSLLNPLLLAHGIKGKGSGVDRRWSGVIHDVISVKMYVTWGSYSATVHFKCTHRDFAEFEATHFHADDPAWRFPDVAHHTYFNVGCLNGQGATDLRYDELGRRVDEDEWRRRCERLADDVERLVFPWFAGVTSCEEFHDEFAALVRRRGQYVEPQSLVISACCLGRVREAVRRCRAHGNSLAWYRGLGPAETLARVQALARRS